jgi:hypothetical protein
MPRLASDVKPGPRALVRTKPNSRDARTRLRTLLQSARLSDIAMAYTQLGSAGLTAAVPE